MKGFSIYLISFLVFFPCLTVPTVAQWSNDPEINNPICTASKRQFLDQIISDGSGGAITTWRDERSGQWAHYAQRMNAAGVFLWTTNGVVLSTVGFSPVVSDGEGGMIITWSDNRNGTDYDIFAQRINANGVVEWTSTITTATGNQNVINIVSDGSGGAIILWANVLSPNNNETYAQHIDGSGTATWTLNGIFIRSGQEYSFASTSDGAGGAIIAWQNSITGTLHAQKINSNGVIEWGTNGVTLTTTTGNGGISGIISNGSGGAIVTWVGDHDKPVKYPMNIYVQCVSATGVVQWTENGIAVCKAVRNQWNPQIASNGAGGAIITWDDERNYATTRADIYAQHITALGTAQWTANGIPICTFALGQERCSIVSDAAGGAIITWEDWRSNASDIYAQRVNASGSLQWTTNGVPISTAANGQDVPQITFDGLGGAFIAWTDSRDGGYPNLNIYAQWVSSDGNLGNSSSIRGKKFLDANGNCIQDSDEPGLQNWVIKLEPGPHATLTDREGKYSFHSLFPGTYTVSEEVKPYWGQTCPPSPGTYVVNLSTQIVMEKDFGNQAVQSVQDLAVSVGSYFPSPLQTACCGQEMTYQINYSNLGTVSVSDARVELHLLEHVQYQETILSDPGVGFQLTESGKKLIYFLPSPLMPEETGVVFVTVLLTCPVESSPMIVTHVRLEPYAGDAVKGNNIVNKKDEVSCSYDPNDKAVTPQGCGVEGYITSADSLTYLIRFQNMGSGPAYRVIIRDMLDNDLDVSTVTTLGSSHPYAFTKNGSELIWTFWNIMLPPEITDEPGSHGYIRFSVKQQAGNTARTVIQNQAGIYFDLNPVVMTNQTTNTITTDPMPVADFTVTPSCAGNNCTYDFTYTGGTLGATFEWDFGHGANPATSTEQNPVGVVYSTFGEKVVSLRAILGTCYSEPAIQTLMNPMTPPQFAVNRRWNLVSVPYEVTDYTKSVIFPTAISNAFAYEGNYSDKTELAHGVGYWLKFSYAQNIYFDGTPITTDSVEVNEGWNLVGSVSQPVVVTNITSVPHGLVTTQFFGYKKGYVESDSIQPGRAYWVKVNQNGQLILSAVTSNQLSTAKIHIVPTSELPPPPPEGDGNKVETSNMKPETFLLEQNYPNPFNPLTVIRYQLPVGRFAESPERFSESFYNVTLKVYNVLGQEVVALVDGVKASGYEFVEWDASNVPNGVYFYKLTAGNFVQVRKMILSK